MYVRACVYVFYVRCACVRACVRARVRMYDRACARLGVCVRAYAFARLLPQCTNTLLRILKCVTGPTPNLDPISSFMQVLVPCGHKAFCKRCAKGLKECLICNAKVTRVQTIFHV